MFFNNKRVGFNMEDEIFDLIEGKTQMKEIPKCKSCQTSFNPLSKKIMCTFCAYSCCQDCTKKTMFYPKSPIENKRRVNRGLICRMCDRKLFVKSMIDK